MEEVEESRDPFATFGDLHEAISEAIAGLPKDMGLAMVQSLAAQVLAGTPAALRAGVRDKMIRNIDELTRDLVIQRCDA